ncbi:hypothetical protein ABEDC_1460 [Acinetobacter lwoffii]|nr:hypothetical protein ABEDC_1460 [Acinetobacter lwoffii]
MIINMKFQIIKNYIFYFIDEFAVKSITFEFSFHEKDPL